MLYDKKVKNSMFLISYVVQENVFFEKYVIEEHTYDR